MSRPDYIKCIEDTHTDSNRKTWCGKEYNQFEFTFLDIEHAAFNGRNGGRLAACKDCIKAITKALDN